MYVISDSCVACGTCSDTCPNEAISMDEYKRLAAEATALLKACKEELYSAQQ